jgi:hypothetical protein
MYWQPSRHLSREFTMSLKQLSQKLEVTRKVNSRTQDDELCDEFEIWHQFLAKYIPQSNGLVLRKNRTLIDMARSMLSEYNVGHSFWAEAISTGCYYSN